MQLICENSWGLTPWKTFGWILNIFLILKLSRSFFHVKINSGLTHSYRGRCSPCNIYKSLLKVSFLSISIFLDLWTNVLQCHLYCNYKLFLCICIWQDEACPLIKEGRSKRMGIQGQTLAKTLIIQFHLHLLTNKQWLADFKILYISFTFTNIKSPFMKSILQESTIISFAILWNICFSIMFCSIHWNNIFFTFDVFFFDQNITYFPSSFTARPFCFSFSKIIVIFAASITSAPLTC